MYNNDNAPSHCTRGMDPDFALQFQRTAWATTNTVQVLRYQEINDNVLRIQQHSACVEMQIYKEHSKTVLA